MGRQRLMRRLKRNQNRVKHGLCDQCHDTFERAKLRPFRGRQLCGCCMAKVTAGVDDPGAFAPESSSSNPALAEHALYADEAPAEPQTLHEQFDVWLRWSIVIFRCAFYLAFFWIAQESELARHLFKGMILGDVVAWGVRSFADLRRAKLSALFEFFAYIAIVRLFYEIPGALHMPDGAEPRAYVGIAFMVVFTARMLSWLYAGRFRCPSEVDT